MLKSTKNWEGFWNGFAAGTVTNTVAAGPTWRTPIVPNRIVVQTYSSPHVNQYINRPFRASQTAVTNIVDHILRYTLQVGSADVGQWTNRTVTLTVWHGRYGSASNVFYSEFCNPGDL